MPKSKRQNLKIFYIADYLMKETDGELDEKGKPIHGAYVKDIQDYLKEEKGIEAEAHSISRDIDLLGGVWKGREKDEIEKFKPILSICGGNGRPYYLDKRLFSFEEIEAIAESIATAKFISDKEAEELIEKLKKYLCSWAQEKRLKSDNLVQGRHKFTQKGMLEDLAKVRKAVKDKRKINFYYTKRSTSSVDQITRRRKGTQYTVSPFKIVLSDGNHYLISYDDTFHQIRPYRIDRMEEIEITDRPVEGADAFKKLRISDYTKQTFGMFFGDKAADYITIRFENILLDSMYERFGNGANTTYEKIDDKHFTVKTLIVRSEHFYGWICGFGSKAVIISPEDTVEEFKDYLKKIQANY